MTERDGRTVQLVLHYDGAAFSGWQRQPSTRTVQGVLEDALAQLCQREIGALGAGRTDAGVHATGQAVGVQVPDRWEPSTLRRALNGILPDDVWVAAAHAMRDDFHARYGAIARAYRYRIGTDESARSPFRRRWEWALGKPLALGALADGATAIVGTHSFRAFAVRGTAPEHDDHRCTITRAEWRARAGGVELAIEANRFLHHMVRFLVGTMVDVASGRRAPDSIAMLLGASDNRETSAPAPAHGLCLEAVRYPAELYLDSTCGSFSTARTSTTSLGPSAPV